MVPIEMAFFFKSTPHGRVIALYPSPAGPMESLLSLDTWTDIAEANPVLNEMKDDVVALLVNRVGHARGSSPAEYYLVPIDECYKLVGLIRTHWRGLSGGTEAWRETAPSLPHSRFERVLVARPRMPDLRLSVESAEVVPYAAIPSLAFKVQVANIPSEEVIHTIALRAQKSRSK